MKTILQRNIFKQPLECSVQAGLGENTTALTTLKKPDGSKTANMIDTLVYMAEQLIPEDNPQDDADRHKNIIRLTEQLVEPLTVKTSAMTK
jgi:hypothetical protein